MLLRKLLDFVGLYGTILMPMGAVVFVDFYLLEKFGLKEIMLSKNIGIIQKRIKT